MSEEFQAQLEAHGLYLVFIAAALLLVVVMTVDAVLQARRDRRQHQQLVALNTTAKTIQRGLVAERNTNARLQG